MKRLIRYLVILLILFSASICYAQSDKVDLEPLKVSITNGTITVTTSPTAIPTTNLSGRKSLIIVNISANNVFLGDANVTTSNGYQLYAQQAMSFDFGEDIVVYGVASSNSEVRYMEAR